MLSNQTTASVGPTADAIVPTELFAGFAGPMELVLKVGMTGSYVEYGPNAMGCINRLLQSPGFLHR